jgi:hypothetical protein
VLSAATGFSEQGSLFDDQGAALSLDAFFEHHGYCDSSNIWWLKSSEEPPIPSKDVHVLLSGATNEFAVTARCSREDHEYVLRQLLGNN